MTKRPKHAAVVCDTCDEWTTVNVKRLSTIRGDTDRRRGIPCRSTPKCQGRQRLPEQLELWQRKIPEHKPDVQMKLWSEL